ncbi:MAG: hypothetical protein IPN29_09430 [Saprospiraceae bacterium]|nr:hypothetical protein [Saprospiraceae bacterium]
MEKGLLFNLREKLLLSFLLIGFSLFNAIDVNAACPGSYNSLTFGTYTGMGDVDIEIGGVMTNHDTIIVTGNANITGDTLNLSICNTFSPVNGTTVTFWNTGGTLTGTFFDVNITGNGSNLSNWIVRYDWPNLGDISAYYCGVSVAIAPITGLELCVGTQFGFIANKTPGATVVTNYTWTTDNAMSVFSDNNSPAASSIDFTPGTATPFASADTLIVAMTTDQGCVVYDTVEIQVNPDILVDVTLNPSGSVPSEMCENGSLNLKGTGSGGNSSLNYSWDVYVNNIAGFAANFFTNPVSLNNNTGMTTTTFSIPPGTISGITTIEIVLNVDDATTCESADTVTITVVPEPDIALVTGPTSPVCSGVPDNVSFTVSNPNGNGDTFYWTASYGLASGNGSGCTSGTTILDTVTNLTNAPIVVTYTVWASTTINGDDCGDGCLSTTPISVLVTILPEPVVASATTTVCSDEMVGLNFGDDVDGPAVVSYNIVNIDDNGLSGAITNATTGAGQAANAIFNDTWTNTTSGDVDVTYYVVTTDGTCLGDTFTITVTVNPEPVGVNDTDETCSDVALAYDLQDNVDNLGNAVSSTFSWVATPNPNVTGESTVAVLTNTINDVLTNVTGSPEVVIYTVTPTSNPESCLGSSFTVTVTVNPEPVGLNDTDETCSGVALAYDLQNNVDVLGNGVVSTFSWVATPNPNVTGESLIAQSGDIDDVLINTTGSPEVVIYTVIPASTSEGCVGSSFTITVTVNPEPVGLNDTEVTCSDVALTYDLQNNVNTLGNGVTSTFSWVAADNPNVTGESLTPVLTGTITDLLNNVTSNPEIVVYTVTPTSSPENCEGAPFTITVTVNPEPVVAPQNEEVCSDETFNFLIDDDVDGPSATTYNITNINMNGLTPSGASVTQAIIGTDNIGLQTFSGPLGREFTVTVPVTISQLGAFDSNQDGFNLPITVGIIRTDNVPFAGPEVFTGSLDPFGSDGKHRMRNIAPVILPPGVYRIVAAGYGAGEPNGNENSGNAATTTSPIGGLTYGGSFYSVGAYGLPLVPDAGTTYHAGTFGVATPITTGNGFSSYALFTHAYTNVTPNPVDVVYTVVPVSALGCEGDPFTVTVTVNPEPVVLDQTATICSDVAIAVTLGDDPDGPSAVTYDITSIDNGGLVKVQHHKPVLPIQ